MRLVRRPFTGYASLLARELTSAAAIADPKQWRSGFSTESARMYGIEGIPPGSYLSDVECVRSWSVVGEPWRSILETRDARYNRLVEYGFARHLPEVIGMVVGHRLLTPNGRGGWADCPVEDLWKVASAAGGVLVQPVHRRNGRSTTVRATNGSVWIDNRCFAPTEAERRLLELPSALVSPLFAQHPDLASLHPGTLNSIRLLTAWPEGLPGPVVAEPCLQQVGTLSTAPFARWGEGGLVCRIELDGGALSPALQLQPDMRTVAWDGHPETGAQLTGAKVPFWEETKDLACSLSRALPDVPYVEWEFLINHVGPMLLDADGRPEVQVYQAHAPLLDDPVLRELFQRYRVVDGRRQQHHRTNGTRDLAVTLR